MSANSIKTVLSEVIFNKDEDLTNAEGMILYAEVNAEVNPADGSYEGVLKGVYTFEVEVSNTLNASEKGQAYRRKNLKYLHLDDPVKGLIPGSNSYIEAGCIDCDETERLNLLPVPDNISVDAGTVSYAPPSSAAAQCRA